MSTSRWLILAALAAIVAGLALGQQWFTLVNATLL
jgi:hypothetical protein